MNQVLEGYTVCTIDFWEKASNGRVKMSFIERLIDFER